MMTTRLTQPGTPLAMFQVTVSTEGSATVIAFHGEADLATLPAVIGALTSVISDHDGAVIVDLGGTTFIDIATLRVFDRASKFLADHHRTLTIRHASRMALRLLGFLGLSDLVQPAVEPATSGPAG